jgi:hypothetical protein
MSCKDIVFYLVCVTAWFVLLPLLVVGGTIALVGYALFSELRENFLGRRAKVLDKAAAREMARRLCLGN